MRYYLSIVLIALFIVVTAPQPVIMADRPQARATFTPRPPITPEIQTSEPQPPYPYPAPATVRPRQRSTATPRPLPPCTTDPKTARTTCVL